MTHFKYIFCEGCKVRSFENVYYFLSNDKLNLSDFFRDTFKQKHDSQSQNKPTSSQTSKPLVIDVENPTRKFTFNFKGMNYQCSYCYKKIDLEEKVFKVNISLNYTSRKERAAYAFSDLIRTIHFNKKSDFNMIIINDSLSTYYSKRLYSKLAFYERSMRALISAIFIPVFKDSWATELQDVLGKEIKGNKKEILEGALEKLDLSDLESIFFDEKLYLSVDNYDSKFKLEKIDELSKEKLVKIIKQNRPISLWEKEISKYAFISNAQERMKRVRGLRNKIAHNKSFSDKNFNNLKKELNFITPKLNEAEDKILDVHDTETLNQTLKRMAERIGELQLNLNINKPYLKALDKVVSTIKETIPKNMIQILSAYSPSESLKMQEVSREEDMEPDE